MIDAVILKIPAGAGHVFSSQDELQKSFKVTDRNALGSFITYIRMKSAKKICLVHGQIQIYNTQVPVVVLQ